MLIGIPGDTRVRLEDRTRIQASQVQPGMRVRMVGHAIATVEHVVEMQCRNGTASLVTLPFGVGVAPGHPVFRNGAWQRPTGHGAPAPVPCTRLFAFACRLGRYLYRPALDVGNGVGVALLGHDMPPSLAAPRTFWGAPTWGDVLPAGATHHVFGPDAACEAGWNEAAHITSTAVQWR